MLHLLIVSNLVIGASFLLIAACCVWLYLQRNKDWPKAWVICVIGVAMATCGLARVIHGVTYIEWPNMATDLMVLADLLSAITALFCAFLIPKAFAEIKDFPTPEEYKETQEKAARTMVAEASERYLQVQKKKAEERTAAVIAMLSDYQAIDPQLKDRMFKILEEH